MIPARLMRSPGLQAALVFILSLVGSAPVSAAQVGRVFEDSSGSALDSAEIRVLRVGAGKVVAELETDSNGQFELAGFASRRLPHRHIEAELLAGYDAGASRQRHFESAHRASYTLWCYQRTRGGFSGASGAQRNRIRDESSIGRWPVAAVRQI